MLAKQALHVLKVRLTSAGVKCFILHTPAAISYQTPVLFHHKVPRFFCKKQGAPGAAATDMYGGVQKITERLRRSRQLACATTKTLRFSLKVKGGLGESENLLFP